MSRLWTSLFLRVCQLRVLTVNTFLRHVRPGTVILLCAYCGACLVLGVAWGTLPLGQMGALRLLSLHLTLSWLAGTLVAILVPLAECCTQPGRRRSWRIRIMPTGGVERVLPLWLGVVLLLGGVHLASGATLGVSLLLLPDEARSLAPQVSHWDVAGGTLAQWAQLSGLQQVMRLWSFGALALLCQWLASVVVAAVSILVGRLLRSWYLALPAAFCLFLAMRLKGVATGYGEVTAASWQETSGTSGLREGVLSLIPDLSLFDVDTGAALMASLQPAKEVVSATSSLSGTIPAPGGVLSWLLVYTILYSVVCLGVAAGISCRGVET